MYKRAERPRQPPSCHARSILGSALLGIALILLSVACAGQYTTEHLYAIGQTAEIDGWRVTVHSFSVLPADRWHQPTEGHVLCAVELTLENQSERIRFVMHEKQMTLLDGDGRAYAPDRTAALVAARLQQWLVPDGELSIGERARGAAAYQIPSEAQGVRWVFRSSLFPWARSVTFVLGKVSQQ